LTGALRGPPPFYKVIGDSVHEAIGGDASFRQIFLVAHSAAGALVATIADGLPYLRGVIFLDALLPQPGQSWFDTAPENLASRVRGLAHNGFLPPWHLWWPPEMLSAMLPDEATRAAFTSELKGLPLAYFEERAPKTVLPAGLRCTYVRLSDAYEAEASCADSLGWPVVHEPLDHFAMLTKAAHLAAVLDECTGGTA
jgi:hypothetical protein